MSRTASIAGTGAFNVLPPLPDTRLSTPFALPSGISLRNNLEQMLKRVAILLISSTLIACAPLGRLCAAPNASGTWTMNAAKSELSWSNPRSIVVSIRPDKAGEIFTYERLSARGEAERFSAVLYFDGRPRTWKSPNCPGTRQLTPAPAADRAPQ